MKKVLMFVCAVVIAVAFAATGFAQAPPAAAPEKAAPAPAAEKAKMNHFTGEVTAMDMAAKTLTVRGKKGDMTFDVTNAKMKGEPKAGDKDVVRYMEKDGKMVAKFVGPKKAWKKKEKTEAPAPAPAPGK